MGTTARLRAEMDSGRGDKVATMDPATPPGTGDEAAGTAPTVQATGSAGSRELKYAEDRGDQSQANAALAYTVVLAAIAVLLVGVLFFIIPRWA